MLHFKNVTLQRNVTEKLTLGGLLKSLEAQEAMPGFMFDGKGVIGGNFLWAGT